MTDCIPQPWKNADAEPRVSLIWSTPNGDQLVGDMARVSNSKAQPGDDATKLIGYLIRNHHWSPFEMVSMCVEIRTTRDISAQILRHRSFSFQEFSTRYAALEELEHYKECRFQDTTNRQSSIPADMMLSDARRTAAFERELGELGEKPEDLIKPDIIEQTISYFDAVVNEARVRSMEAYEELLRRGVAKEVARTILPIGLMPTRMYMAGTVRSWVHYLRERLYAGAQKEHRRIAEEISDIFNDQFPNTYAAASDHIYRR